MQLCIAASEKNSSSETESHNSLGRGETYHAMMRRVKKKCSRFWTTDAPRIISIHVGISDERMGGSQRFSYIFSTLLVSYQKYRKCENLIFLPVLQFTGLLIFECSNLRHATNEKYIERIE